MLKAERESLIETIFSSQEMFERNVLDITCEEEREEVVELFANMIIRVFLKEEFSFLYIKNFKSLKFPLIINHLFKELANEWVYYCEAKLGLSKSDALAEMQSKERVAFMLSIAKEYFTTYKIYFAQEIADTFIELIDIMTTPTLNNDIIKEVLKSPFVRNKNISVVHNYNQLWNRVKNAHNNKNTQLAKLQIKIAECVKGENPDQLNKYEYEEEILEKKSLAFFDEAIKRLRDTMVNHILVLK